MDRPIDVEDLVGRAREGDADAFGRLATHFWRPLVGLARSVLAPADGAEDAVQDALVVAWGELARLERDAAFGAWVRRILVRRCLPGFPGLDRTDGGYRRSSSDSASTRSRSVSSTNCSARSSPGSST